MLSGIHLLKVFQDIVERLLPDAFDIEQFRGIVNTSGLATINNGVCLPGIKAQLNQLLLRELVDVDVGVLHLLLRIFYWSVIDWLRCFLNNRSSCSLLRGISRVNRGRPCMDDLLDGDVDRVAAIKAATFIIKEDRIFVPALIPVKTSFFPFGA